MMTKPTSVLCSVLSLVLGACQSPVAPPAAATPSAAAAAAGPAWRLLGTPGQASLRGLAAVDGSTAWVSGNAGTIWRTTDGGKTWSDVAPPGTGACDFRDVEAFDADVALAMVAGQPARVYRTADGGASWQVVLEDRRQAAFFDGMAFVGDVGCLFGDPIDGAFCVFVTRDAGVTWSPVPRDRLPAPLGNEAAFAASGTAVAASGQPGNEQFWVATGGGERARVLRGSNDGWQALDVPMRSGSRSQGGFGLAFGDGGCVLVGGDYEAPLQAEGTGARSEDGGNTWQAIDGGVRGFRSAATWLDAQQVLAVGSHGTSLSRDGGRSWAAVEGGGFHCLARGRDGSVWAAGSDGRVARCQLPTAGHLRLGALFGDHMVLPANTTVPFTGRGLPGATVTVRTPWLAAVTAEVGADGRWRCDVPTAAAGGPHTITVASGFDTAVLADVLLGEVWLASGQSNMEMLVGKPNGKGGVKDKEREVAAATLPTLRVFTVGKRTAEQPGETIEGEWTVCSPATAGGYSAVGFFFARELVRAGKGPIGLVVSAWGGTVAEAWTSEQGLAAFPEFAAELAEQRGGGGGTQSARLAAFWRAVDAAQAGPATTVAVPDRWSQSGLADFDGVASYTREIDLPAALRGKPCWLELGALDDMDTVWWNGERIGGMAAEGAWDKPRRYAVAAERTAGARATLRVRVVDTGGEGGFSSPAAAVRLVAADDASCTLPLAGDWQRRVEARLADLPRWPPRGGPNRPAVLWNGMVAPLLPFPFTGAIWYQGESNRGRAAQYARLFPALIQDWRRAIGRELPFYFVQIAPFGYENDRGEAAALRAAQAAALALPATGMAVTLDCGDAGDIHPIWKQPVGERLAALALAAPVGNRGACVGPVPTAVRRDGDAVRVSFANADGGLQLANDGAGFELAGADGRFVAAAARRDGDDVVLSAAALGEPTQVRYAWAAVPQWSLRNGAGFLAAPFRAAIR